MSDGVITALQAGFATVQSSVTEIVITALPYAVGIMALTLAIRVGMRFFRREAK